MSTVSGNYYGGIVRQGLLLLLDSAKRDSYVGYGTEWADISRNQYNATLINGPTFNSANGGSIVFDGTNDLVTIGTIAGSFAFTAGQAVTISGWLYSTATTVLYRNFVDTLSTYPMIWWNSAGQIEFDTASGYTTVSVYRNQWVYVSLVKPSGTSVASYYVNGSFVSNGGVSYSVPASIPTWFNRAAGQTWIGNCANISVYNRALTSAEILQNYNALKHRFGL